MQRVVELGARDIVPSARVVHAQHRGHLGEF